MARLAHQIAMLSPQVTADVIEATEFPQLSRQYRVQAVPKTVINNRHEIVGAIPESYFIQELAKVIKKKEEAAQEGQRAEASPPS
jgi:predicted DsbA family dithiol-disulfide isomerase